MSNVRRHVSDSTKKLDTATLSAYSRAAIENAEALFVEASLLNEHGHSARAYFLAVASIEEIGKSLMAFDAQGRNLSDPAVVTKLNRDLSDHKSKIRSAFVGFLVADPRKNIEPAIDLIIALQRAREPAMYTDLGSDLSILVPAARVRDTAAQDCERLARDLLASAHRHIAENKPQKRSIAEDQLFALRSSDAKLVMSSEDFWWYYIDQVEKGNRDFAVSAIRYRTVFLLKERTFREPSNGDA